MAVLPIRVRTGSDTDAVADPPVFSTQDRVQVHARAAGKGGGGWERFDETPSI
jgi:hypothetical protein